MKNSKTGHNRFYNSNAWNHTLFTAAGVTLACNDRSNQYVIDEATGTYWMKLNDQPDTGDVLTWNAVALRVQGRTRCTAVPCTGGVPVPKYGCVVSVMFMPATGPVITPVNVIRTHPLLLAVVVSWQLLPKPCMSGVFTVAIGPGSAGAAVTPLNGWYEIAKTGDVPDIVKSDKSRKSRNAGKRTSEDPAGPVGLCASGDALRA